MRLFELNKIPLEYSHDYMDALEKLVASDYIQEASIQIDLLKSKKLCIRLVLDNIEKRESILNQIKIINKGINEKNPGIKVIANMVKLLENLRMLNLVIIEDILQIRISLKKLSSVIKPFILFYKGENYFHKIIDDYNFIANSEFGRFFKFGKRLDIFFLTISRPVPNLQKILNQNNIHNNEGFRKTVQSMSISRKLFLSVPIGELYNRIKNAEIILMKEAEKNRLVSSKTLPLRCARSSNSKKKGQFQV